MWTLYKHLSIYNYYYKAKEHLVKFGRVWDSGEGIRLIT